MIGRNESCTSGQISMTYLNCLVYILEKWIVVEYLEKYYLYVVYCLVVMTSILSLFMVPIMSLIFLYLSAFFLLIYQRINDLKADNSSNYWDGARRIVSALWDGYAKIWHGYELHGVENLPEGPGVVIYYHGAVPIDYFYFLARLFIVKHRVCVSVADRFVFKLPGLKIFLDVFRIIPGTKEECLNALKNGYLVAISPGGVREALFSDETYKLVWGNRKGFAQVAIDAKVPIIPMYTENVREGYRSLRETRFFRWLYEFFRLPVFPPYGGFPVKFRTYIGDPIPYDPNITAAELAEKTKTAVQSLIQHHQKIPGSVLRALMERFHKQKKKD